VCRLVGRLVSASVGESFVHRLVGQSVVLFSRSVAGSWNRLDDRSVVVLLDGGFVGWWVGWLADGWWVDWSVDGLVGGLDGVGWLVGGCIGEFVGLWEGWLSGG
jgi:hypothetical protein